MNKIIIITAPSGSGKTSLVKEVLKKHAGVEFSISACTRNRRENEENGRDYHFMTPYEFRGLIKSNKFVEWEQVYEDKYYGTMISELNRIWGKEKIPIIDIDVKGALTIKEKYPNSISIYIKVPLDVLKERLENRGTETKESIEERLKKASDEFKYEKNFDVVIVNDDFDKAFQQLNDIITDYEI